MQWLHGLDLEKCAMPKLFFSDTDMPRKILYELINSGNTWTRKEENCIMRDLFANRVNASPASRVTRDLR